MFRFATYRLFSWAFALSLLGGFAACHYSSALETHGYDVTPFKGLSQPAREKVADTAPLQHSGKRFLDRASIIMGSEEAAGMITPAGDVAEEYLPGREIGDLAVKNFGDAPLQRQLHRRLEAAGPNPTRSGARGPRARDQGRASLGPPRGAPATPHDHSPSEAGPVTHCTVAFPVGPAGGTPADTSAVVMPVPHEVPPMCRVRVSCPGANLAPQGGRSVGAPVEGGGRAREGGGVRGAPGGGAGSAQGEKPEPGAARSRAVAEEGQTHGLGRAGSGPDRPGGARDPGVSSEGVGRGGSKSRGDRAVGDEAADGGGRRKGEREGVGGAGAGAVPRGRQSVGGIRRSLLAEAGGKRPKAKAEDDEDDDDDDDDAFFGDDDDDDGDNDDDDDDDEDGEGGKGGKKAKKITKEAIFRAAKMAAKQMRAMMPRRGNATEDAEDDSLPNYSSRQPLPATHASTPAAHTPSVAAAPASAPSRSSAPTAQRQVAASGAARRAPSNPPTSQRASSQPRAAPAAPPREPPQRDPQRGQVAAPRASSQQGGGSPRAAVRAPAVSAPRAAAAAGAALAMAVDSVAPHAVEDFSWPGHGAVPPNILAGWVTTRPCCQMVTLGHSAANASCVGCMHSASKAVSVLVVLL
eukprot:jgi/Mesvir1/5365/Mv15448-RA.2